MRVIAGKYKGRKLKFIRSPKIRPMQDRVKEAIFDTLGDLDGLSVLDPYAGTGQLGIEALSRGASQVTLVEPDRGAVKLLKDNLQGVSLQEEGASIKIFAGKIENYNLQPNIYNVILSNPPFSFFTDEKLADDLIQTTEQIIYSLASGGILVLMHPSKTVPLEFKNAKILKVKKYGDTSITYYER